MNFAQYLLKSMLNSGTILIKTSFLTTFLFFVDLDGGQIYRTEINYKTNKVRLFLIEEIGKKRLLDDKIYSLCSAQYLKNIKTYVLGNKPKHRTGRLKLIVEADVENFDHKKIINQKESLSLSFFCKENGRITPELSLTELSDQILDLMGNLTKKKAKI